MLKRDNELVLKYVGSRPIKHFGQHFLISKKIIARIITAAEIKPGETILEVGPGTGNLTRALLDAGAEVIAVEKDEDLVKLLNSKLQIINYKQNPNPKLQIIKQDILQFDEKQIAGPYRIVANIPYYLTGKLIQKFLMSANQPSEMILMVQKEVGERIAAQPPQANYLSSLVGFLARTEILFGVGRENFWPRPKVDSGVVKIKPKGEMGIKGEKGEEFIEFLKTVFRQPRQTLFNNLARGGFDKNKIENVFKDCGLTKNTRAQTLSVGELIKLFRTIKL